MTSLDIQVKYEDYVQDAYYNRPVLCEKVDRDGNVIDERTMSRYEMEDRNEDLRWASGRAGWRVKSDPYAEMADGR